MRVDTIAPNVILDVEGSLDRFGGDKQLFAEMTAMVLEDAPPLYTALQTAVRSNDDHAVECRAHALKGLLINCGGVRGAQAAQKLEDAGHRHNLANAATLMQSLEEELELLASAIRNL